MRTALFVRAFCIVLLALLFGLSPLRAEDWKTVDGKVYQNVTVLKSEPDAITILYREGGALVPLASLPADLQRRFNYDPIKAQTAADERAKSDAASAQALHVESEQAQKLQAARDAKDKAEQKEIADRKRAEEAQYHNRMPDEPVVLEKDKKVGNETFNPPK